MDLKKQEQKDGQLLIYQLLVVLNLYMMNILVLMILISHFTEIDYPKKKFLPVAKKDMHLVFARLSCKAVKTHILMISE